MEPNNAAPAPLPTKWVRVTHHSPAHIAPRYLYAAYGSNLNLGQMLSRCPDAEIVGPGKLHGARLFFSRVASIKRDENVDVLLGVYKLTVSDVAELDRFEGLGRVYERILITPEVEVDGQPRLVRCFTYVKKDEWVQAPSENYYTTILHGFHDWNFPDRRLRRARARSVAEAKNRPSGGFHWGWGSSTTSTTATTQTGANENSPAQTSLEFADDHWKMDASRCKRCGRSHVHQTCSDLRRFYVEEPRVNATPALSFYKGQWGRWITGPGNTRSFVADAAVPRVPTYDELKQQYDSPKPAVQPSPDLGKMPKSESKNYRGSNQTVFYNHETGETWNKVNGVWKVVKRDK